jgi:hypothetical protein
MAGELGRGAGESDYPTCPAFGGHSRPARASRRFDGLNYSIRRNGLGGKGFFGVSEADRGLEGEINGWTFSPPSTTSSRGPAPPFNVGWVGGLGDGGGYGRPVRAANLSEGDRCASG